MTPNIPSKNRLIEKLKELKKTKPNADLSEVIKSKQIKY
jgi:hypothetical protein